LELALGVIVPPYMAVAKPGPAQKKVTVSDSVPNVFVKGQAPGATQSPAPGPKTPAAPAKPSSSPAAAPAPKTIPAPANLSAPPAASKRPEAPSASAPAQAPAPAPASAPAGNAPSTLTLDLKKISENWPEAIRKEIDHMELAALRFEVPLDVMENGLRFGKVDFLWKQICTWIKNCPPAAPSQLNAETRVELPLNIVAPLYLKVRPPRPAPKPASIAVDVPDVFSPTGRLVSPDTDRTTAPPKAPSAPKAPAAPAPVAPAPVASPAATAPAANAAPAAGAQKQPQDIAELFGEPEKRNWTPNEIVHKTACLPGVAGAMIALQDGLLVAQCLPPNWKTETIAAFLPQIFGRMNQYSKELKMGDLRNISFTVEHGTFLVFNAGIIYFAALGKPGADLPSHELNIIAAELSRHTK
jgi:predicted regulator of Ras-like GTPase activity (Roadblock/LC7/MglB family)